jgi:large subunit ribosomal protein L6
MITGCDKGFERVLEINGVGYRAEVQGTDLVLNVGFSHQVRFPAPEGITFESDAKTRLIKVKGRDRQQVGQVASNVRKIRPPEHYHGTGIRYQGEFVKLKAGKAGKTGK